MGQAPLKPREPPRTTERRVPPRMRDKLDARADPGADRRVARRSARQWGVISHAELEACGLSRHAISRRVTKGWLHQLHRGVYAVGHDRPPLEGRFLAAVKACGPAAVLSHYSAGALLGLVRWDGRRVEVTVPTAGTRLHGGMRVHRSALLDPSDIVHLHGIAVTSPARTVADLAAQLSPRELRRAARQAQSLRLVELRALIDVLVRLGPRRGSRKLARIIATGPAPTRSELEDVVLDLILGAGLTRPDVNVPIFLEGRRVVPDFRWATEHLVVEADGAAWHEHKLAREDDAERQALLEAHGEHVIRVTWDQAVAKPRETLTRIQAAGAPNRHRASTSAA